MTTEDDFVPFDLEELRGVELGVLIPIALKMGIPEAAAAKRDTIVGMVFVAQNHHPGVAERMREKLMEIRGRHTTVSRTAAQAKPRQRSAVGGSVSMVWEIADAMKSSPRSEVIAACIAKGININTAKTQYYKWSKEQGR